MLADVRPLLTDEIQHLLIVRRDLYGQVLRARKATRHAARLVYKQGNIAGPASSESMPHAKAIVWLLNHPRPIATGDYFELPNGDTLSVIGGEWRISGSDTLHKVYLS